MRTIPVIDIAPLLAGTDEAAVAKEIGAAGREGGLLHNGTWRAAGAPDAVPAHLFLPDIAGAYLQIKADTHIS